MSHTSVICTHNNYTCSYNLDKSKESVVCTCLRNSIDKRKQRVDNDTYSPTYFKKIMRSCRIAIQFKVEV